MIRFFAFSSLTLLLLSCGDNDQEQGSQSLAVSFPDTSEGRAARQDLIDRATVDGLTPPKSLAELVAGPATAAFCHTTLGDKTPCQPKYLGTDGEGRPIIRFPELQCDFIRPGDEKFEAPSGRTSKFYCLASDANGKSHKIKIKYQSEEVFTEVASTRLLWSFGFAVDTVQPVTVTCNGCPEDPFPILQEPKGSDVFPPRTTPQRFLFAAFEEKYDAEKINIENDAGIEVLEGFTYPELLKNLPSNPHLTEQEKNRRETLAFLNAFLFNLDAKSENQRLACLKKSSGVCQKAVAIAQDVGFTFGSSPVRAQKLDLAGWRELNLWKHPSRCDASHHLRAGPVEVGVSIGLSEGGRQEVEILFEGLTTEWLRTLFDTARFGFAGVRFDRAATEATKASAAATVDAWAEAFEHRIGVFKSVRACPKR